MAHKAKILKYDTQSLKVETGNRESIKQSKEPLMSKHFTCSLFDAKQMKIMVNVMNVPCDSLNTDASEYSRHFFNYGDGRSQHPCDLIVSGKTVCSTCGVNFASREQQVNHYKMSWHLWNLKEKMKGNSPLSEIEYNQLLDAESDLLQFESDEEDKSAFSPYHKINVEFSETSTTNSDDDVEYETIDSLKLQPKVFFEAENGKTIGIYRCVIYSKKEVPDSNENLSSVLNKISEESTWAIILIGGGYFAAALYEKNTVILHKTFHRYTVRAKQGGSQSLTDGKQGGRKAKSAGAALRRYNEAALIKEVQELLNSWAPKLSLCHRIFYRAPSYNRSVLFGGKNPPLNKKDERLRTIPFPTARATFEEIQRVHKGLSTLECLDREKEDLKSVFIEAYKKPNELPKCKVSLEVITTPALELSTFSSVSGNSQNCELEKCQKYESGIQSVIDFSALPRCNSGSQIPENMNCTNQDTQKESNHSQSNNSVFECNDDVLTTNDGNVFTASNVSYEKHNKSSVLNEDKGHSGMNIPALSAKTKKNRKVPLLCASKENNLHINDCPRKTNDNLSERNVKSPILVKKESTVKEIETSIVVSNIGNTSDLSNDDVTQLENTVTESIANEKSAKNIEKCKEKKKAKKARYKEKKALSAKLKAEEEEVQKFISLSDKEKISVSAGILHEVKFKVLSRCFQCGLDITGKMPFEYLSFKFCNMSCLKEHKTHHQK